MPGLKEDAPGKSQGPTLEGTEEFGMSEVVERPKYRPLVVARREYDTISAPDPAAMEHRLTVPGERPRRAKGAVQESEPIEDEEIALAPPVEIAEAARDPRTVLPNPELEPEDPLYDGKYDDGIIGDSVDPRTPDAWKRAPLVYGIVEFLFLPSTILRLVMFCAGLAMVAGLVSLGISAYQEDSVLVLFVMWGGIPVGAVWLFSFFSALHAVIVGTANGENEVAWPDWNIFDWFIGALYMFVALVVSILPGGLIAAATFAASLDDPLMAAFGIALPPILSWLILFPVVMHSMLAEDSVMAIASSLVMRSLSTAADAWIIFYAYSIGIAFLLAGAGALLAASQFFITAVGACALVAVLMLYARLLGRLMWYTSQKEAGSLPGQQVARGY